MVARLGGHGSFGWFVQLTTRQRSSGPATKTQPGLKWCMGSTSARSNRQKPQAVAGRFACTTLLQPERLALGCMVRTGALFLMVHLVFSHTGGWPFPDGRWRMLFYPATRAVWIRADIPEQHAAIQYSRPSYQRLMCFA